MQILAILEDSASSVSPKSKLPRAPAKKATECHWMVGEFVWITQSRSGVTHQHPEFTWELAIQTAAIAVVAVDIIEVIIVAAPADPADPADPAVEPAVTIADPEAITVDLAAITVALAATTRITTHLAILARTAAKWLNILL